MSKELVCITCPLGCRLSVETLPGGELSVSGNRCPRGAAYAREEFLAPKRVVTATARISCAAPLPACPDESGPRLSHGLIRRAPVRTTAPFPKESVPALLEAIYKLELRLPITRGEVVLRNALGTGIDVIATRTITV